jgi:hypothetical protein
MLASRSSLSLPAVSLPAVSLPAVSLPAVSLPAVSLPAVSLPVLSLPLLIALGCGGKQIAEADGSGLPAYDACADSASLARVVIHDFEGMLPMGLSWFTNSDGTSTQLSPVPPGTSTTPLEAPKCPGTAAGSGFHIVATQLQSWGYSFGFNGLNALPGAGGSSYFDANDWDGLSMWVRKGSGPSASSIFASVSERYTDPTGAALFTAAEADLLLDTGGYCDFNARDVNGDQVSDPLLSQCDRFGAGVGIATEWRFFKVPFSRMRQRAFGRPSAQSGPDQRILGLDFGLDGENWDFWIDDLAFYRDAE